MIEKTYPSQRPKPVYKPHVTGSAWFSSKDYQQATIRKITPLEYVRREKIVADLHEGCPFRSGDTGYPSQLKDYEKYGAFLVTGVLSTYSDTAYDYEWPKSDTPMILTIKSLKDAAKILFCTPGWLVQKNPHLLLEQC